MKRFIMLLALMAAGGLPAWAQEAIGYVKTVSGEAFVIDAGKAVKAQPGTAVRLGSVLRTGAKGSMGVTLKDDTVMSFGPDTELVVDEYLYAPGRGDLRMNANMSRGTLQVVSGVIARLRPGAATVRTPTGTIGVRGTNFLVKVEP